MFAQVTAATLLTDCQNSIDVIERILAVYMCQWALHVIIKRKFFTLTFAVFLQNLFYRCILSHKPIYGFVKTNGSHFGILLPVSIFL